MCKFNPKNDARRIDPCMKWLIHHLNNNGIKTLSSCCGHGKYPMSLVVQYGECKLEIFSYKVMVREKKFYKKDKQGVYYIPETTSLSWSGKK